MKTSRKDSINARGLANGWHAQELQKTAERQGQTMAEAFAVIARNSMGFNVPAKCTKVDAKWIYYEFLDGSTDRYMNQSGQV